ncbi:hypothetical protein [Nocardia aurea]|uniref:hypothetical protein n=1 Tax=Nocardia aurea TaxID=2144174 RepID=UPI0033AE4826
MFSIGDHLCTLDEKTVVSPMAGIPTDPAGKTKHETLRAEHAEAMSIIGADIVNGPFLDDVYPAADRGIFNAWLITQLDQADTMYVPLGIHHPDHLTVSNAAVAWLIGNRRPTVRFYAELPYRLRYPGLARERLEFIAPLLGEFKPVEDEARYRRSKEAAVRAYASQTDEALIAELMVPEQIWEVW